MVVPPLPPLKGGQQPQQRRGGRSLGGPKGSAPAGRGTGLCYSQQETLTWFHWYKQLLLLPHTGPGMDIRAARIAPERSITNSSYGYVIAQEQQEKLHIPSLNNFQHYLDI